MDLRMSIVWQLVVAVCLYLAFWRSVRGGRSALAQRLAEAGGHAPNGVGGTAVFVLTACLWVLTAALLAVLLVENPASLRDLRTITTPATLMLVWVPFAYLLRRRGGVAWTYAHVLFAVVCLAVPDLVVVARMLATGFFA